MKLFNNYGAWLLLRRAVLDMWYGVKAKIWNVPNWHDQRLKEVETKRRRFELVI